MNILVDRLSGQQLVSYYLMASYLYYNFDISIMPDSVFDAICARFLTEFDSITHPHKHLVTKGDLEAGTGFHVSHDNAPLMLQNAAWHFFNTHGEKA